MLVEMRCYSFAPGTIPDFLRLYEAEGLSLHRQHLGRLIGYFTADSGDVNQLIHIWAFDDHTDRALRRAALYSDHVWLTFAAKCAGMVQKMETRFLTPTAFSPLR